MSDYRYQIVEHNGIECLHVMIDTPGEELCQTYIPMEDIRQSAMEYTLKQMQSHGDTLTFRQPVVVYDEDRMRQIVREEIGKWERNMAQRMQTFGRFG